MPMEYAFVEARTSEIEQALREDNLDYFHQVSLNNFYLEFAFSRACHFGTSDRIIEHLIALVKPQAKFSLYQACHDAISGKNYNIARILFKHNPNINIFDKSQLNRGVDYELTLQYVFNLALREIEREKDKPNQNHEGLSILQKVIDNLPHEHTLIFKQDKYRDAYEMKPYHFIYNKLLSNFLWAMIQPFSSELINSQNQDTLLQAIKMLAQKSFSIRFATTSLIKQAQLEYLFPYHFQGNDKNWKRNQHKINSPQGLAHRTALAPLHIDEEFWAKQKLAIYKELSQHFQIPDSLNEMIYDDFVTNPNRNRNGNRNGNENANNIKRRLPSQEEYQFLIQFEHSTQNHKRVLNFFNQFLYYNKMHLHEKLKGELEHHDSEAGLIKI